jgi:hypothetical protein
VTEFHDIYSSNISGPPPQGRYRGSESAAAFEINIPQVAASPVFPSVAISASEALFKRYSLYFDGR